MVVALATPTSPRVTDVGQVGFTVLPVPPAAAEEVAEALPEVAAAALAELVVAAPPAVVELELEQAATALMVSSAAAASGTHLDIRMLRTAVSSPLVRLNRLIG